MNSPEKVYLIKCPLLGNYFTITEPKHADYETYVKTEKEKKGEPLKIKELHE